MVHGSEGTPEPSLIAYITVGTKYDFQCINICWAPREVLKPEPERQVFQHLPRGPADVNVSEKHVRSLLLHKTFFSLKIFGEIVQKVL